MKASVLPKVKQIPEVGEAFSVCDLYGEYKHVYVRIEDKLGAAALKSIGYSTDPKKHISCVSLDTGKICRCEIEVATMVLLEPTNNGKVFRIKKGKKV